MLSLADEASLLQLVPDFVNCAMMDFVSCPDEGVILNVTSGEKLLELVAVGCAELQRHDAIFLSRFLDLESVFV